MILRRLGNKSAIAKEIQKYFPPHKIYIEPFFGAGGMFFNKKKANCNIVNDLDSDVFTLFQVVSNQKIELEKAFLLMPKHQDLLSHWMENRETEPIKKALRFLFLSNYTFLGKQDTLKLNSRNDVRALYNSLSETHSLLFGVQFANMDFRKFLNSVSIEGKEKNKTFIYCDPPYLNQTSTYSDNGWDEQDSKELFETLISTGCKFAISEFDNPIILELAKEHNLEVITIGERQNLKNRRTEILIINYSNPQMTLFDSFNGA